MQLFGRIIQLLDTKMTTPAPYGACHLIFLALSILAVPLLLHFFKNPDERCVLRIILAFSVAVLILEIYKQINYSFSFDGEKVTFDYQWYAFPFQFCSTPMYAGLLAAIIPQKRLHRALCAYLATFATFAGICVMAYPVQIFVETAGINLQTVLCHGSMITLGIYLLASGYVKRESRTIGGAVAVFAVFILGAMIMNEIAFRTGLLERETFNMFFISPYCEPSLPVYSEVQRLVAFPFCTAIYIGAFSLASYLILLISIGAERLLRAVYLNRKKTA